MTPSRARLLHPGLVQYQSLLKIPECITLARIIDRRHKETKIVNKNTAENFFHLPSSSTELHKISVTSIFSYCPVSNKKTLHVI